MAENEEKNVQEELNKPSNLLNGDADGYDGEPQNYLSREQESVAIRELAEKMKEIREKYGLTEQETILDANLVKEIQINGKFGYNDIYALMLRNAKGETYHKLVRQDGSKIATLKKGKYTFDEEETKRWEDKGIEVPDDLKQGEEDEQDNELQEEIDDFEGKETPKEPEKEREKTQAEKDLEAAKAPHDEEKKGSKNIAAVIKVEDTKDFGKAIGTGVPEGWNLYIIRYTDNTTAIVKGHWPDNMVKVQGMESTTYSMNFLKTMGMDKTESKDVMEMEENIETYKPKSDLNYTYTVISKPMNHGKAIVIVNGVDKGSRRFEIDWGEGIHTIEDIEEQLVYADSRTDNREGHSIADQLDKENEMREKAEGEGSDREKPDEVIDYDDYDRADGRRPDPRWG